MAEFAEREVSMTDAQGVEEKAAAAAAAGGEFSDKSSQQQQFNCSAAPTAGSSGAESSAAFLQGGQSSSKNPSSSLTNVDSNSGSSSSSSGMGDEDEEEERLSAHTAASEFSDDREDSATGKEEEDDVLGKSPEERMTLALSCKDHGNDVFKSGDITKARENYKNGLKYLKDLEFTEARSLRIALNGNIAMCCLKTELWQETVAAAEAVLKEDPNNVKALYRRGMARIALGLFSEAKADLLQVVKFDPKNTDVRKELENLKEKISKHNSEKRKAFSGLFDRAAGMYDDREAQMRQKRLEAEQKEKQEREDWEKEMEERAEEGKEEISFEKWKEEKGAAAGKERERERSHRAESPSASVPSKSSQAQKSSSNSQGDNIDSLELDEEDQKILKETKKMGYCYFRRDLTEEEKKLNAQHIPTKIEPTAAAATRGAATESVRPSAAGEAADPRATNGVSEDGKLLSGVSSWNAKGTTYEEKDMSQWAKKRFEERLLETKYSRGVDVQSLLSNPQQLLEAIQGTSLNSTNKDGDTCSSLQKIMKSFMKTEVKCTGVSDLSGEAQVVVMRGSKRFLFEFTCVVKFDVKSAFADNLAEKGMPSLSKDQSMDFQYSGEITLPEVSSAESKGMAWLTGSKVKVKKVQPRHKEMVDECIEEFKKQLVQQIHYFLADFSKAA